MEKPYLTQKQSPEYMISSENRLRRVAAGENALQMNSVGKAPGVTWPVSGPAKKRVVVVGFRL